MENAHKELVSNLVKKVESGEIKIYAVEQELSKHINDWNTCALLANEVRRKTLETKLGLSLTSIKKHNESFAQSDENKQLIQIEQCIGSAIIPLGIAGPILISGEYAKGNFYVPIATNESALIAGLQRGIKATNMANGIKTVVKSSLMTRAPVVECSSIEKAKELVENLNTNKNLFEAIANAIKSEAKYSKLVGITAFSINRYVWMRLAFDTNEAMGMNSATKYSAIAVSVLKQYYQDLKLIALSGNLCTDKKSSHVNILLGRGVSVEAECIIPEDVLFKVFGQNVSVDAIVKTNNIKNHLGSELAGTFTGFNANAANTVAGIFIATGQDAAQIVESSSAFVYCETIDCTESTNPAYKLLDEKSSLCKKCLKISVTMPNIEVGTVGGGTVYHTAKECLSIMDCLGGKSGEKKKKLAEIICAAVLCQELNLLAALVDEFKLAESHVKLARGEKSIQKKS
ncbi:MAG: hydroxymethylglutaryl-CoA reductase [Candidatus Micrarchaeota archaeon]|nr:hydroxymethylglutaryl-CoA reductase [Candidatus Micrarchaeota archaeon]